MIVVYRYRVKSLNGLLNSQARAVNFVWNFCNDTQKHALKWGKSWPTGFALNNLTAGTSKELGLHANTINAVCEQYVKSRYQFRRPYLRYRGRRSLGWIPIKGRYLKTEGDAFRFAGNTFRVFDSRPIPPGAKIKDGSNFARNTVGNWYLNVTIEIPDAAPIEPTKAVGIDLGLKSFAVLSTGEVIDNPRHFIRLAGDLAKAQRARKKRQAAKIHNSISCARRDFLHKLSTRLVTEFDRITVGDVSAGKLAKTKLAKSVNDVAWSSFRQMLRYKAIARGAWFEEVDESCTTRTCNTCGVVAGPAGLAGLKKRTWTCIGCGYTHDRDLNSARNILERGSGHRAPVEGIGTVV